MKKTFLFLFAVLLFSVILIGLIGPVSFAQNNGANKILREGLLGAGAGAVGGAASGAHGGDLWKGALAGAGVNIVGGVLLDSLSGEQVGTVKEVDSMSSQSAYKEGYSEGFQMGYKQGYKEGIKEGME